jgi:hypothetical protein
MRRSRSICMVVYIGVLALLLTAVSPCFQASASGGLLPDDPMIKICALPIDKDIDEVLVAISQDVSRDTGIGQEYITYYWQTLANINCMGKKTTDYPILVDLYVPGFFDNKQISTMMTSLAAALEKHTGIDRQWVFIQTHFPKQGQVYLSGEVQVWEDYKGPENAAEYDEDLASGEDL